MRRLVLSALLLGGLALAATAFAARIGVVPPSVPSSNCRPPASLLGAQNEIDYCRALEGVGSLVLPKNWRSLSVPKQLLVLINLERVNRGLPPDVGLTPALDKLAQQGARDNMDPGFPSGYLRRASATGRERHPALYDSGGSIWADNSSTLGADFFWMYEDGYGAGNEACQSPGASGCWGHRGIILSDVGHGPLVGGGGYAPRSYTFEQLYNYSTAHLVFTWAAELRHFRAAPGLKRLRPPRITRLSPEDGALRGGTEVTIWGSGLAAGRRVRFGSRAATGLRCVSNQQCTVTAPTGSAGTVTVSIANPAGTSAAASSARFTYR
jgi:hypothetical protein